jgi:hypothetical protein
MKIRFILLSAFFLIPFMAQAESSAGTFEGSIEPALLLPFRPQFGTGTGVAAFLGFPMDNDFSLGIQPGIYSIPVSPSNYGDVVYSNAAGGVNSLELPVVLKGHLADGPEGPVWFFVMVGGGLSFFSDNSSYSYSDFLGDFNYSLHLSETVPAAKFALGLDFKLGKGVKLELPIGADILFPSYGDLTSLTFQPGLDFAF